MKRLDGETTARRTPDPCPICGKPSAADTKPFCSSRCADVDLGRWLGERYVIPGPDGEQDDEADGSDRALP